MNSRSVVAGAALAVLLTTSSGVQAQESPRAQLDRHVLPVAAGALVGAAVTFFIMPLIVPGTAVTVGVGATTASPMVALIGASIGGVIGYGLVP